jgi:hypothetical protein
LTEDNYKSYPIYGFAIPVIGAQDLWRCQGLVIAPDDIRTIEIQRIEPDGLTFPTQEEAEQHALALCKEWIDGQRSHP